MKNFNKNSSLLQRIEQIIENKNISYNKFEIAIGASRGTISRAIRQDTNIGSRLIENILHMYPEISAEWLLRGEGQIWRSPYAYGTAKAGANGPAQEGEVVSSMEKFVLSTWEKRYGAELRGIKQQLEIFFRDKLDQGQRARQRGKGAPAPSKDVS
ncbi:MAG: hypothetical protein AB3N16_02760 [Flavobacteriaceae bacterium]